MQAMPQADVAAALAALQAAAETALSHAAGDGEAAAAGERAARARRRALLSQVATANGGATSHACPSVRGFAALRWRLNKGGTT